MVVGAVNRECVPPKIAELIVTFRFTPRNRFRSEYHTIMAFGRCCFRMPYPRRRRTRSAPSHAVDRHLVWQSRSQLGMSVEVIVRRADEAGTEANP